MWIIWLWIKEEIVDSRTVYCCESSTAILIMKDFDIDSQIFKDIDDLTIKIVISIAV